MQDPNSVDYRRNCIVGGGVHCCKFYDVISLDNLFQAWKEFRCGKRSHKDVALFELHLEESLIKLHYSLNNGTFEFDPYKVAIIQDPKKRIIHIASVRDRILYQAVYRKLYHVFDKQFICDVYSSRNTKGTHAGVKKLNRFIRKVTQNFTRPAFVLKCDIRKFFDTVKHDILIDIIKKQIKDKDLCDFLKRIIRNFNKSKDTGIPLGNVTSQLFANIYMDKFDQFVKHKLKAKYYIRYCDDFVILDESKQKLQAFIPVFSSFLKDSLDLELHPRKTKIRKIHQGIDFLGYVSMPNFSVLRTSTKNRIIAKVTKTKNEYERGIISQNSLTSVVSSYVGMLKHCSGEKISAQIERIFWD